MSKGRFDQHWNQFMVLDGLETFEVADANSVIDAVGVRPKVPNSPVVMPWSELQPAEALTYLLNNACFLLRQREAEQSRPHAVAVERALGAAITRCNQLSDSLTGADGSASLEFQEAGLELEVMEFLSENGQFSKLLSRLAEEKERVVKSHERRRTKMPSGKGPSQDKAWAELVNDLAAIYDMLWERPTVVRNDYDGGKPSGGFIDFAHAVVEHITPETRTREAIATVFMKNRPKRKAG